MTANPLIPARLLAFVTSAALLAGSALPSQGHEFWIDPEAFEVAEGAPIVAATRVGEGFKGSSYSYNPANFRRYQIAQGDVLVPVEGRLGDRPSLDQAAPGDGLAVVVHETTDSRLTYEERDKFESFVTHKDAAWVLDAHAERGLPETGFSEAYSRYAKALVAVGDAEGADRNFGLLTELVALANPYTDDLSEGLPVALFYEGAPRAGAQVEVFEKAPDGAVAVSTFSTDADGRARVPVRPGHRYMLDAVVLREPPPGTAADLDVVWESLWANLTFAVPER